jgi:hypothetical protein
MASQIAIAAATGGAFLQWRAVRKMLVAYANFEINARVFGSRMLKQLHAPAYHGGTIPPVLRDIATRFHPLHDRRSCDVLDPAEADAMRVEIARIAPDLIVYDVLARMHCADEQSSDMKRVMQSIRTISGGAAHVIVHHTRKPGPEATGPQRAQDIRGSSALHGECDLALILSRRPGQGPRYVVTTSARSVSVPDEVLMDIADDLLFVEPASVTAGAGADTTTGHMLLDILYRAFLKVESVGSRALTDDIADGLDVQARQAKNHLRHAVDSGWLVRQRVTENRVEYERGENWPFGPPLTPTDAPA